MSKHYILGLDLGIASIGWCLYEGGEEYKYDKNGIVSTDDEGNPIMIHKPERIADLGSFVFNQLEDNKGKTENKKRGESRRMRRQRRRKVHRLERLRDFFQEEFKIDFLNDVIANRKQYTIDNPFEIKIKGLTKKLSKEELMIALYHYMKYRGFKSNRKAADNADKENKELLGRITKTKKELENSNCSTITEYFVQNWKKRCSDKDVNDRIHNCANKDIFNMDASRDMYLDEINKLLDKQIKFGVVDSSFKEKYLELYKQQRGFSDGPGFAKPGEYSKYHVNFLEARGNSIFDGKPRAIKDSITAKRFVLLSALNNFRYKDNIDVRYHGLTPEQIRKAEQEIIYKEKCSYSSLLKLLDIKKDNVDIKGLTLTRKSYKSLYAKFLKENETSEITDNLRPTFEKEIQKKKYDQIFFKGSELISEIKKSKNKEIKKLSNDDKFYNDVAEVLFANKDDDKIQIALEKKGYSKIVIVGILEINADCKRVIDLSTEICEQLILKMRDGLSYDKALKELGYDHRGQLDEWKESNGIPEIDTALKIINVTKINNPVVKNTLVNLRRVVNAIIDKYGCIDECVIELDRELKNSFKERQEIRNTQLENYEDNIKQKLEILNKYSGSFTNVADISRDDLVKYRLFKEQNGISPYTGKRISESNLFSPDYEVDHIMPYSRSFDDSFKNKVLVEKSSNQHKGNKLPFEVGGDLFNNVKDFLENNRYYSKTKRENLLRQEISEEFQSRNLNDTSYITKIAKDLVSHFVLKDKRCRTTNGTITSFLRRSWNLSGKTHTYALSGNGEQVSYENKLYQANFDMDYKFVGLDMSNSASKITFNFQKSVYKGNKIEKVDFPVEVAKIQKKEGSKKELTDDENYLNQSIEDFIENYSRLFYEQFSDCIGKTIKDITELIKGSHMIGDCSTEEYAEHLDAANRVLTEVLSTIQKDIDVKNRDNHLHHALDAAIIGTVTYATYHKFSNANKNDEVENLVFEEPYEDFKKEVLARVYERNRNKLVNILKGLAPYKNSSEKFNEKDVHVLIPVRQPKTRVEGAISNETIYGVGKTNKNKATKKVSVLKLEKKDLDKVVDKDSGNKAIYLSILEWFDNGKSTTYPILLKKGTYIKYVKIYDSDVNRKVPLSQNANRFADNSEVVRVEIYKKKDGVSTNLYAVPVYYYQIVNRKRGLSVLYTIMWARGSEGSTIIDSKDLKQNYEQVAILPRYSLIEIELKDDKKTLVYSGGATTGQLEVYSLVGDYLDLGYEISRTSTDSRIRITISSIKSIKVRSISVLGKVS